MATDKKISQLPEVNPSMGMFVPLVDLAQTDPTLKNVRSSVSQILALATNQDFVPQTREVSTFGSLTGGGTLNSNLNLALINDSVSPGNLKYYGTDSSGSKGFFSLGSGSGTLTSLSVGNLSPIFTSGVSNPTSTPSVSFSLISQSANRIFAGPASGGSVAPTFRALVAADIPSLSSIYQPLDADLTSLASATGTDTIYYRSGASTWSPVSIGANLTFASGTLSASGGGGGAGTVTSVDLNPPAEGIQVFGGPITTSGSITLSLSDDLASLESLTGTDVIYYRAAISTWLPIAIGGNLTFSSGILNAIGNGTVTSVDITPPTEGIQIFNGPITSSGSFLLLLSDDLAALESLTGVDTIYYRAGASAWAPVNIGGNLTFSSGVLNAVGAGSGTVTLFSAIGVSPLFTTTVNTATTTPALSFDLIDQSNNMVFAGPSSPGAGAPSFRSLVPADIPDISATYQPLNAELTAITNLIFSVPGFSARLGTASWSTRTMTGTSNQVIVANGDGQSGDPTFALPQDIHTGASPSFTGLSLTGGKVQIANIISTGAGIYYDGVISDDVAFLGMDIGVDTRFRLFSSSVGNIFLADLTNGNFKFNYPIQVASNPPSSATDTGETGTITYDSSFIYVCTSANTWVRASISTW
jgi:hypothetical protein